MVRISSTAFDQLQVYYGDIHNHCDLSYGQGSLSDALTNARRQLDFASVTVHAAWPDIPTDNPDLDYLIDYHREGFVKAVNGWDSYLNQIDAANQDDHFVTFPSFEWHSIEFGDHCVYYKNSDHSPIIDAPDLPSLRARLHELKAPVLLIPHHIGYKQGSRGINWQTFDDHMSPVVEVFSFHGLSESSEGPYPYLHSMGPRHEHSTAQFGWAAGNIFGIVGSTDHHNAFPGSYGYGRMGVWATSLTRDGIWDAIQNRRTYALTGDRIALAYTLNDVPIGGFSKPTATRHIEVAVEAGSSIDYIDVLHNNQVIHRENVLPGPEYTGPYKVYVEMGWAEQTTPFSWEVDIEIQNGRLVSVEPRLRGYSPTATPNDDIFAYHQLEQANENKLHFSTRTRQNLSLHTPATEGFSLEVDGTGDTRLLAIVNGKAYQITLEDLRTGSRSFYTGGFVSPAICFHRAVPRSEYDYHFTLQHRNETSQRDWYYVRVRQRNNQWAWSSPIWVEGSHN